MPGRGNNRKGNSGFNDKPPAASSSLASGRSTQRAIGQAGLAISREELDDIASSGFFEYRPDEEDDDEDGGVAVKDSALQLDSAEKELLYNATFEDEVDGEEGGVPLKDTKAAPSLSCSKQQGDDDVEDFDFELAMRLQAEEYEKHNSSAVCKTGYQQDDDEYQEYQLSDDDDVDSEDDEQMPDPQPDWEQEAIDELAADEAETDEEDEHVSGSARPRRQRLRLACSTESFTAISIGRENVPVSLTAGQEAQDGLAHWTMMMTEIIKRIQRFCAEFDISADQEWVVHRSWLMLFSNCSTEEIFRWVEEGTSEERRIIAGRIALGTAQYSDLPRMTDEELSMSAVYLDHVSTRSRNNQAKLYIGSGTAAKGSWQRISSYERAKQHADSGAAMSAAELASAHLRAALVRDAKMDLRFVWSGEDKMHALLVECLYVDYFQTMDRAYMGTGLATGLGNSHPSNYKRHFEAIEEEWLVRDHEGLNHAHPLWQGSRIRIDTEIWGMTRKLADQVNWICPFCEVKIECRAGRRLHTLWTTVPPPVIAAYSPESAKICCGRCIHAFRNMERTGKAPTDTMLFRASRMKNAARTTARRAAQRSATEAKTKTCQVCTGPLDLGYKRPYRDGVLIHDAKSPELSNELMCYLCSRSYYKAKLAAGEAFDDDVWLEERGTLIRLKTDDQYKDLSRDQMLKVDRLIEQDWTCPCCEYRDPSKWPGYFALCPGVVPSCTGLTKESLICERCRRNEANVRRKTGKPADDKWLERMRALSKAKAARRDGFKNHAPPQITRAQVREWHKLERSWGQAETKWMNSPKAVVEEAEDSETGFEVPEAVESANAANNRRLVAARAAKAASKEKAAVVHESDDDDDKPLVKKKPLGTKRLQTESDDDCVSVEQTKKTKLSQKRRKTSNDDDAEDSLYEELQEAT